MVPCNEWSKIGRIHTQIHSHTPKSAIAMKPLLNFCFKKVQTFFITLDLFVEMCFHCDFRICFVEQCQKTIKSLWHSMKCNVISYYIILLNGTLYIQNVSELLVKHVISVFMFFHWHICSYFYATTLKPHISVL